MFATAWGAPIDPRNDVRAFKAILAEAGLRDVRLHDLRHTAASLLLAQSIHPRVVMELLGHSQIGLTMNTYSHVMPSLMSEAADSMAGTLWAAHLQEPKMPTKFDYPVDYPNRPEQELQVPLQPPYMLEPTRGLELLTARLQVGCATNCATPACARPAGRGSR